MPKKPPVLTSPKTNTGGLERLSKLAFLGEVKAKILDHEPLTLVARYIHEKGEYADVNEASLVRVLQRYKRQIPPGDFVKAALPQVVHEAEAKIEAGLNVLDEIGELFRLQKARITKLYKVESEMQSVLFPNLSQEFRVAAELLQAHTAMRAKLGLTGGRGGGATGDERDESGLSPEMAVGALELAHPTVPVGMVLRDPEKVHKIVSVLKTVTTFQAAIELSGGKA